ncbi:MAG TPA: beta-propeller domain-containing protein [Candidatus Nanoarchaeia archaeon]|nr:beta-propeller domain-containing protein [Candidatus Nanoarchaeia archaeon]
MKNQNTKIFYTFGLLFLMLVMASCTTDISNDYKKGQSQEENPAQFQSSQELKKFSSNQELMNFLDKANANDNYGSSNIGIRTGIAMDIAAPMTTQSKSSAAESTTSASSGATDYSQTNVQVQGVDEADIVKNDDKYIYTLTQNKLVIIDAYPADNAKILSETKIGGNTRNIFVNGDRLVVFSDGNDEVSGFSPYDFRPSPRYTQKTHAFVYDISDRANPELLKDYNLNGYYLESRMIDNYVYFVAQENVYYYSRVIDTPVVMESSNSAKIIVRPEIYYFDNPESNYNFNTVASFNILSSSDDVNAKTFMMGYSNNIYVSKNNVYITYQKNFPYNYYELHNEDRFFEVVVPLLTSDAQNKIENLKGDNSLNSYQRWDKISTILEEMYNNMDESGKNNLIQKIENAVNDYEARLEAERRKTIIHRIAIDNGKIEYGAKGEVSGYLLNQFSMDENGDYFRVATTTEIWTQRENVMYNNVFVLDNNLKTVGKLEAIAPDERIYSARFLGDRLYMVTFKRIDPLFVIDLSNPQKPEVLGELKIPGFSDYLHPYDENHIIGIGKETEGNEWGGISTKGVKLALFDVSDVKNPKQLSKYEIGSSGTDSEALRDHKAFLFDKKKNLLVIPVTEIKGKMEYDPNLGYYRQRSWQGAYVFNVDLNGFEVKGKITHNEGDENQDWYWYGSPNAVRRSLFIDSVLYTVSDKKIKANDLNNVATELKEIKLPYEQDNYPYPVPYYKGGVGIAEPRMIE